jgi:hypothetical protein
MLVSFEEKLTGRIYFASYLLGTPARIFQGKAELNTSERSCSTISKCRYGSNTRRRACFMHLSTGFLIIQVWQNFYLWIALTAGGKAEKLLRILYKRWVLHLIQERARKRRKEYEVQKRYLTFWKPRNHRLCVTLLLFVFPLRGTQ